MGKALILSKIKAAKYGISITEDTIQKQIVTTLLTDFKYRDIRKYWGFHALDNKFLTPFARMNAKAKGRRRGHPDFYLPGMFLLKSHTVISSDGIRKAGFYLELKAPNPTKRKGVIKTWLRSLDGTWKDDHIKEQAEYMEDIRDIGCYAQFAIGYEDFFRKLDNFLKHYKLRVK